MDREKEILVSVVIPTYNRSKVLSRAIDSVINQTFKDWELLIVDDRSIDHTCSLIDKYKHTDSKIKYLLNEYEQGPGGARNFGIDHASGQYIAFLDSDDLWYPNHLEDCLRICQTDNIKICCGLWYENRDGNTIESYPRERHLEVAISELSPIVKEDSFIFNRFFCEYVSIRGFYFLKTSFLMINRSILEVTGKFDPKLRTNQDVDFFFRITLHYKVALINKIHGVYFNGDDNLYFFKDSWKIFDKGIVSKLNFHRKYYLRCYKKRIKMIKAENNFIFKSLMLHSTFWTIQYTYGFLSSINQPFSPFLAKYYFILKQIYSWRCSQSNKKGSKYFHNSYQFRFKEQITHMEFKKILMKSIFGIQQAKYQKQYYVFIENHIILAKGNNSLSLYNPANERILYLENIKSKTLINALGKNSFHCSMKELLKPSTFSFIQKLYQNRMGGLVTIPEPLAQVKFQNNSAVGKIYFENKFLIQGHNSFMPILTFYINDKCNQECSVCQVAFRQHIYCTCKNSSVELHLEAIKKTINDFLLFAIPTINIIGGNLMLYKELNELHSFLQKSGLVVNYYINYLNINNSDILSKLGSGKSVIHFLVNLSDHRYKRLESLHSLHVDNVRLRFLIQKKEDIKAVNNLCKNIDDEKVDLEPFFSGKNKLFFKKYVFLSQKEILKCIDAGHVQLRSIVNAENIGKLFILPNGEIKTNMNENSLGNIYINSLTDLLNSNAIEESSWFRIRKSVEPCYRCINNPFCPSISDFEYETGHKICKDVKIPSL